MPLLMRHSAPSRAKVCLAGLLLGVLSLVGCGGGGSGQAPDPVVVDLPIAYVKRPVPLNNNNVVVQPDARRLLAFNAGGDVWVRDRASASAPETNITGAITGGVGDVKDLESSYDGSLLVFSLRLEDPNPNDMVVPTWNLYVYQVATKQLKRVILSDIIAEGGDDVAPHFLPDGRLLFTSNRQRTSRAILLDENAQNGTNKPQFAGLEESGNENALVLHVLNIDCSDFATCEVTSASDVSQISFNQSHDLDPTVLSNGKVLFTRWDNAGNRNAMHLYEMNPDGTQLKLVYGAHSHTTGTNNSTVQFIQPRELPDGSVLTILRPFTGTYGGGDVVRIDRANYADNTQGTWPNQGVLTGPGQATVINNNVTTLTAPSPGGRYSAAYPLWDGTNRLLVSWTPCRLLENNIIVACTPARLANPAAVEAVPLYGLYIFDLNNNTQVPVFLPQENVLFSDVVVAGPRTRPAVIFDKVAGVDPEINATLAAEGTGVLHIRSVYDFDGGFNRLGSSGSAATVTTVAQMADPGVVTAAADRAARFLRIIKAVSQPDDDVHDFANTAFGRSAGQGMREIIGYAPIEPDGSVMVKVPANVPLALSVVDANARRISNRHQFWIQVKAGETVSCTGCHTHNTGLPHGHTDEPTPVNTGASTTGLPFPNTVNTLWAEMGETMAQTRMRHACTSNLNNNCSELSPSLDVLYDDPWTDPAVRAPDTAFGFTYRALGTPAPASLVCIDTPVAKQWSAACRSIINYVANIQPMWELDRGVDTCTSCHQPANDINGNLQVAAAQLDLRGLDSQDEPDHVISYRELMFNDNVETVVGGVVVDLQCKIDANTGNVSYDPSTFMCIEPVNPLCNVDGNGNPIVDPITGACLSPVLTTVPIAPVLSVNGANSSNGFFSRFAAGGSHAGRLTADELRLISEWLDIGGQYYNNPFDAPAN